MKTIQQIIVKLFTVSVLFGAMSCKQNTDKSVSEQGVMAAAVSDLKFKDTELEKGFLYYLQIKNALVASDAVKASKGAEMLSKVLMTSDVKNIAEHLAKTENIAEQRKLFSDLTLAMKPMLETNLVSGVIYEQFCPMALGKGASWFAVEQEINNPYYGDKMLHCGTVQAVLK